MFFSLGDYFTHNGYWTNKRHVGWMWEKGKITEMICYERQNRDKIVLIVGGISVKTIWLMTQTPVLVLLNYIINPYIPKKGFLDAFSASWSIKIFLVAVAIVSPIY